VIVNPDPSDEPKPLENTGRLLLRAIRAFEADLAARLRARGYTDARLAHSAVFAHLGRDGSRVVDLAERAGMTKQSMGELVEDLVVKGYLERRADPTDRRAKLVVATARGRRHIGDALDEIERIEESYRAQLGETKMKELRSMLAAIAAQRR